MANRDNVMGFRPAAGIGKAHVFRRFPIDASNGTNVFVGDVMALNAAGSVRPAAADAGVSAAGVCVALYDTNGHPIGHPNSAVSTKYLASSTAGYALVAMAVPGAVFVAQSSTASTAPAAADIGATLDHIAGTGSTTTARSAHELDFAQTTALNTGLQFRVVGIVVDPTNAYGQHADMYVVFNESAFGVSAAAGI